jgi:hypothetical protein
MYVQSVVTSGFELLIGASGLFTSLIGLLDCMIPSVVLTYIHFHRKISIPFTVGKDSYKNTFVYLSS